MVVEGGKVLRKSGVEGKSISAACGTTPASDSSGPTAVKCTKVLAVSAGEATKLFVDGAPVLLDSIAGTTNGMVTKKSPQDLGTASAAQSKLSTV
jgi:hypothetical protein